MEDGGSWVSTTPASEWPREKEGNWLNDEWLTMGNRLTAIDPFFFAINKHQTATCWQLESTRLLARECA